jgi:hypothetical protein
MKFTLEVFGWTKFMLEVISSKKARGKGGS